MSTRSTDHAANVAHWDELTAEAHRDRRREPRLKLPYPIAVYGFDRAGHYFMEKTVTLNVSAGGCMVELKHHPESRAVVAIRRVSRDGTRSAGHSPVLFMVCWIEKTGRRWTVGASKLQAGDMWGLSMPPEHTGN
jgi:PilZ domain